MKEENDGLTNWLKCFGAIISLWLLNMNELYQMVVLKIIKTSTCKILYGKSYITWKKKKSKKYHNHDK